VDLGALLIDELGLEGPDFVALVGGGGKTTLLQQLSSAGRQRGKYVVTGTTTKMYRSQTVDLPNFLSARTQEDKVVGLAPEQMDEEFVRRRPDLMIVEADGSRSKVVKAPAGHEPPVPSLSTHVLALIGADGINRVIEDVAHRPMRVAALCGCGPYGRLTPERAAMLMTSENGGRRNVPAAACFAVVITRIGPRQAQFASELADHLAAQGVRCIRLPLLPGR